MKRLLREAAGFAVLLGVWWAASLVSPFIPSPVDVVALLTDQAFLLKVFHAYLLTALRATLGYLIGLAAGVILGVVAALLRIDAGLEPVAALVASVPSIAWIPILIALLGVDELRLPVTAAILCSLPPILHEVLAGLRSLDPEEVGVARSLGARGPFLWRTVILPRLFERIFPAAKAEAIMTWKTVFAAEMVAVPSGLGYLAMIYTDSLEMDKLIFVVALLTATVALLVRILTVVERRVLAARGLGVSGL